ncbi:MAG: helix-turn-helix domain-containing protein [Deltaproteobacteria bacterium]|nr:helix-turn-helix domain-containing protein [Deltaproteobacteria bacterium]
MRAGDPANSQMTFADGAEKTDRWRQRALVTAVASGPGGVGKSLITALIASELAQIGKRVVLVDAALASPTQHLLLGAGERSAGLHAFFRREVDDLADLLLPTFQPNLCLIGGAASALGAANPRPVQKRRLLAQLSRIPADHVVVDLSAGASYNSLDLWRSADLQLVVSTPDNAAIEQTLRLAVDSFARELHDHFKAWPAEGALAFGRSRVGLGTPEPALIVQSLNAEQQTIFAEAQRRIRPLLIVNHTRTDEDRAQGEQIASFCQRHLELAVEHLGDIAYDDACWLALRQRKSALVALSETAAGKQIRALSRKLLALEHRALPPLGTAALSASELLGLPADPTEHQLQRACRRAASRYSESNPLFGRLPSDERRAFRQVIERAATGLSESSNRRPLQSNGTPADAKLPPGDHREPPAEDAVYSGSLLRQLRLDQGIALEELAEQTKISISYLRSIEDEVVAAMPATVYLRGFVKAVAGCLRLDPQRVAQSYLAQLKR